MGSLMQQYIHQRCECIWTSANRTQGREAAGTDMSRGGYKLPNGNHLKEDSYSSVPQSDRQDRAAQKKAQKLQPGCI